MDEYLIFQILWIILVGLVVGSFLNVCAMRLPAGLSIVRPRSFTDCCHRPLPWYDNIPLLSLLFLRGRCRYCGTPVSAQHPAVEGVTSLLALAVWSVWGWSSLSLIYFALISALIVIFIIDFHHYIIPDLITLPAIVIGIALSLLGLLPLSVWDSLLGLVVGGGLLWGIAFLYRKIRKREGLGGGDIKLLAMLGIFLGLKGVLFTLFVSSLLGGLSGIYMMLARHKGRYYALPYGPFIVIGAISYLFFGSAILAWYLRQF